MAIKILMQSKADGQDFVREVTTIGRIHRVNVVQLIGFCFEGSKQALVYDLMSSGSLDKHIFTEKGDKFLNYKKTYEITLWVARESEYLHRGIVSVIATRGTIGYMTHQLFYKNNGSVSYKSDVYNLGRLLMEIVGRMKNINTNVECSSQIYFPLWMYGQVNEGASVEMEEVVEEERKVMEKYDSSCTLVYTTKPRPSASNEQSPRNA
ncbi:hypothetical protein EUGRSUZ_K00367 [Eucalyptus grandis]|uniref:Uncharacterized protein n=2 Tax=Eucalyptus grandis TaxID=71139 RepID=A0ACC3IST5_EUCGR|nr:hypothetical protein EUGRSUZ_K00367 [Eucalyptus grandis]